MDLESGEGSIASWESLKKKVAITKKLVSMNDDNMSDVMATTIGASNREYNYIKAESI
jgi:hypothetical protein